MKRFRKLSIAVAAVAGLLAGGCALQPQADGTVKTVVVGCEATSPAKSLACASATLDSFVTAADKALLEGRMSNEQAQRFQLRFKNVYNLLNRAKDAIILGTGNEGDYLQLADDILAAIEKELAK